MLKLIETKLRAFKLGLRTRRATQSRQRILSVLSCLVNFFLIWPTIRAHPEIYAPALGTATITVDTINTDFGTYNGFLTRNEVSVLTDLTDGDFRTGAYIVPSTVAPQQIDIDLNAVYQIKTIFILNTEHNQGQVFASNMRTFTIEVGIDAATMNFCIVQGSTSFADTVLLELQGDCTAGQYVKIKFDSGSVVGVTDIKIWSTVNILTRLPNPIIVQPTLITGGNLLKCPLTTTSCPNERTNSLLRNANEINTSGAQLGWNNCNHYKQEDNTDFVLTLDLESPYTIEFILIVADFDTNYFTALDTALPSEPSAHTIAALFDFMVYVGNSPDYTQNTPCNQVYGSSLIQPYTSDLSAVFLRKGGEHVYCDNTNGQFVSIVRKKDAPSFNDYPNSVMSTFHNEHITICQLAVMTMESSKGSSTVDKSIGRTTYIEKFFTVKPGETLTYTYEAVGYQNLQYNKFFSLYMRGAIQQEGNEVRWVTITPELYNAVAINPVTGQIESVHTFTFSPPVTTPAGTYEVKISFGYIQNSGEEVTHVATETLQVRVDGNNALRGPLFDDKFEKVSVKVGSDYEWSLPVIDDSKTGVLTSVKFNFDEQMDYLSYKDIGVHEYQLSIDGEKVNNDDAGIHYVIIKLNDDRGGTSTYVMVLYIEAADPIDETDEAGEADEASNDIGQEEEDDNTFIGDAVQSVQSESLSEGIVKQLDDNASTEDILKEQQFDINQWIENNKLSVNGNKIDSLQQLKAQYCLPIKKSSNSQGMVNLKFSNDLKQLNATEIEQKFIQKGRYLEGDDNLHNLTSFNFTVNATDNERLAQMLITTGSIEITLVPGIPGDEPFKIYTWELILFTETEIIIQMNYEQPLEISTGDLPDALKVEFLNTENYMTPNDKELNTLPEGYTVAFHLSTQRLNTLMEQTVEEQGAAVQTTVIAVAVLNVLFRLAMSEIIGSIVSLQIMAHIAINNIRLTSVAYETFAILISIVTFDYFHIYDDLKEYETFDSYTKWADIEFTELLDPWTTNFAECDYDSDNIFLGLGSGVFIILYFTARWFLSIVFQAINAKTGRYFCKRRFPPLESTQNFIACLRSFYLELIIMGALGFRMYQVRKYWNTADVVALITHHFHVILTICYTGFVGRYLLTIKPYTQKMQSQYEQTYSYVRSEKQKEFLEMALFQKRVNNDLITPLKDDKIKRKMTGNELKLAARQSTQRRLTEQGQEISAHLSGLIDRRTLEIKSLHENTEHVKEEEFLIYQPFLADMVHFRSEVPWHECLFTARRLLLAAMAFSSNDYPFFQILTYTLASLLKILYLGLSRPYDTVQKNRHEIINELFVLVLSWFAMAILRERHEPQQTISIILAYIVRVAVLFNVGYTLFRTLKSVYKKSKVRCYRKKAQAQTKEDLTVGLPMEASSLSVESIDSREESKNGVGGVPNFAPVSRKQKIQVAINTKLREEDTEYDGDPKLVSMLTKRSGRRYSSHLSMLARQKQNQCQTQRSVFSPSEMFFESKPINDEPKLSVDLGRTEREMQSLRLLIHDTQSQEPSNIAQRIENPPELEFSNSMLRTEQPSELVPSNKVSLPTEPIPPRDMSKTVQTQNKVAHSSQLAPSTNTIKTVPSSNQASMKRATQKLTFVALAKQEQLEEQAKLTVSNDNCLLYPGMPSMIDSKDCELHLGYTHKELKEILSTPVPRKSSLRFLPDQLVNKELQEKNIQIVDQEQLYAKSRTIIRPSPMQAKYSPR